MAKVPIFCTKFDSSCKFYPPVIFNTIYFPVDFYLLSLLNCDETEPFMIVVYVLDKYTEV